MINKMEFIPAINTQAQANLASTKCRSKSNLKVSNVVFSNTRTATIGFIYLLQEVGPNNKIRSVRKKSR